MASVRSKAPERGSRSNSPALEKAPLGLFRRAELALCPPQGPSSYSAFLALLITVLNGGEEGRADGSARPDGVFAPLLFPCKWKSDQGFPDLYTYFGLRAAVVSNGVAA